MSGVCCVSLSSHCMQTITGMLDAGYVQAADADHSWLVGVVDVVVTLVNQYNKALPVDEDDPSYPQNLLQSLLGTMMLALHQVLTPGNVSMQDVPHRYAVDVVDKVSTSGCCGIEVVSRGLVPGR